MYILACSDACIKRVFVLRGNQRSMAVQNLFCAELNSLRLKYATYIYTPATTTCRSVTATDICSAPSYS